MLTPFLKNQYAELIDSLHAYGNAINEASIIFIADLSGRIIYANEKLAEISNFSNEEFRTKRIEKLVSNQISGLDENEIWNLLKSGTHWHGELKQKTKNNSYYWLDSVIMPVRNEKNEVFQYLAISSDITTKKENQNQTELLQRKLKKSEAFFQNLFENNPFAILIADKSTLQFLKVNDTAEILYGYSKEEFLKLNLFDLLPAEQHAEISEALRKGAYSCLKNSSHKKINGEILKAEIFIAETTYQRNEAVTITVNDISEKIKNQEELLRKQILQQNEISRLSMELHEKNRAEIGRELHDNVNQLLVASNLYLKNIKTDLSNRDLIEKSILINTTAINEIRKLAWSLVPPSLNDLSLKDTIEELSHIFELTNAHFDMQVKIQEDTISKGLKINIYRIIQEQFNNIIKHSNATKVFVTLVQEKRVINLEIVDNGDGFDQKEKKNGIGIMNMIHRVESYNGSVKLESSPGKGCKLFIEFIN